MEEIHREGNHSTDSAIRITSEGGRDFVRATSSISDSPIAERRGHVCNLHGRLGHLQSTMAAFHPDKPSVAITLLQ
ncbi:hypothetical protein SDJN02_21606, partial [Cucurbita argyrosperma subsp. argyrosperma]